MAGIRALFIAHGFSTIYFKDKRIPLFLKSLKIKALLNPMVVCLISIGTLQQILSLREYLESSLVFKALLLLLLF